MVTIILISLNSEIFYKNKFMELWRTPSKTVSDRNKKYGIGISIAENQIQKTYHQPP